MRLAKNAIALPIPVDIPANDVRKDAISTGLDMSMMDWKLVRQKRTKVCFVQKQSEPLFAGGSLGRRNS